MPWPCVKLNSGVIVVVKKWLLAVAAGWILSTSYTISAAGDAATGKTISASCAACHGTDGNSTNPQWPSLAGQHPDYIVKQLQNFKSGARPNAIMAPMTASLSEQDMQNLAAFFSSQKIKLGLADPEMVILGEQIYRGGSLEAGLAACIGCHSPTGSGNPAALFPSLSGQHAAYVVNQLKAFRDGQRTNDHASMMRDIAAKMTEREMQAVAEYLQGLH